MAIPQEEWNSSTPPVLFTAEALFNRVIEHLTFWTTETPISLRVLLQSAVRPDFFIISSCVTSNDEDEIVFFIQLLARYYCRFCKFVVPV